MEIYPPCTHELDENVLLTSKLTDDRYATSAVETVLLLLISCWPTMGFEKTNIVDRMGALTLIIAGEGIIGLTKSVANIMKASSETSGSTVGIVITAVLMIYFLWMLYFDQVDKVDTPGSLVKVATPSCQLWAVLHFPLHVAVLLTLEGSASFMLFWIFIESSNLISTQLFSAYDLAENGVELADRVKTIISGLDVRFPELTSVDFSQQLAQLRNLTVLNGTTADDNTAITVIGDMYDNFVTTISDSIAISIPETSESTAGTTMQNGTTAATAATAAEEKISAIVNVYFDFFVYFFVAAGCVLVILALIRCVSGWASRGRWQSKAVWVAIAFQSLVGLGVGLVSVMVLPANSNALTVFLESPFIIPTVLIAFFLGEWSAP